MECFNCGSTEHKNYECTQPKTSGSAEVKRRTRKEFRLQNPNKNQANWNVYSEKQEYLTAVLKESPIPVRVTFLTHYYFNCSYIVI